ncbi:hypothetical protein PB01_04210 [Psychrobacillus glaciei]|uniref:BIG2 domain-containing protein n=1 Tax=Psychrobacillus glaciei TaxID=2283160 RepID=A0A5J6SMT4_9BACI|nr:S8 family serine peptidase [Psychrobacillus glaciei]QFF98084.1 hypothetical protein PB01_04210 [Psychrobacillus glaciei]
MKKLKFTKFFSSILAFVMVLSMLSPFSVLANEQQSVPLVNDGQSESDLLVKAAIDEQLNLLNSEATIHQDLKGVTGDKDVPVIIHLSEKPVALEKGIKEFAGKKFTSSDAASVEKKVNTQQMNVLKELKVKKISFKQGFSYDTVLNGFAATVKADDLPKLLEIDGVVLVEPDEMRYALGEPSKVDSDVKAAMLTSVPFLEIEKLWSKDIKGQGVKVAVLDTGIDYNHPEFAGVYKGGKNYITHTSQYARPRTDNDPYETSPLDRAATTAEFNAQGDSFYTSHGTHVAGTIAAIGANKYGIKGLAPKVELYAYRVLGGYGSGASSGIIKAIDDSVKDGMNVINLSLGGTSNSSTASDSIAINNAMLGGTVAVVATGNSGPNRGTIGNPSTAALGIAVGNSTNPEESFAASVSVNAGAYSKTSIVKLMGVKFGEQLAPALEGEFDVVAIPGVGNSKDFTGIDVKDKVALISRGDIAFVDKIANAKAAGAKAVLIHNSLTGSGTPGPADVFLGDSFQFIPAFDMSYTEGKALRDALGTGTGKVSFSNITSSFTTGDEMNSSSSRGPANPDYDIKPDVVAPGTNIMSSVPAYGKDFPNADYSESYDRYTGTSMATPHIAGIAALIRQAHPEWTPFDVKVALSNTAKVLDTKSFDVFAQGPGRVQPYEAAYPKILAYALDKTILSNKVVNNEKGTVTFGKLGQVKDGDVTVKKQIRVKDIAGNGGQYTVRVETTKAFGAAKVTVNKPTFTLNGTELIELTLFAPKATGKAGDEILGYIYIEGNGTQISLPFAADFSPKTLATGVHYVKLTDHDISFNPDVEKVLPVMSLQLVGSYGSNYIRLHDLLSANFNEDIGHISAANSRIAGLYTLPMTDKYTNLDNEIVPIPEGVYMTSFYAQLSTGAKAWYGNWDFEPLFVKNSAAKVEAAKSHNTIESSYIFKGEIIDKYFDFQEPLSKIGMDFDVNKKLFVTYDLTNAEGKKIGEGQVAFGKDGAFSLNLTDLTLGENTVTIYVNDAARNKAEYKYTILAKDTVSYSVNTDKIDLQVGDQANLKVTETTKKLDGTTDEKDVTAQATFESSLNAIAKVENGIVTAVAAGEAIIDVIYNNELIQQVRVVVKEVPVLDVITLIVNNTEVNLTVGDTEQLTVTEMTTLKDGEVKKNEVTKDAEYVVDEDSIATVVEGLVTAKKAGTTKVTITHGDIEVIVDVTVTDKVVVPNPDPVVTLSVDNTDIKLTTGGTSKLVVEETSKPVEGEATVKDVTSEAKYVVADNKVVTVEKGLVTAKAKGTTTITIEHGKNKVEVKVTVTDPVVNPGTSGGGSSTPSQPKVEDIKAETGTTIANTTVKRTTELDGTVKDSVTLNAQNVKDSINKLKQQNQDTARIVISDNEDKVNEVNVAIPKDAVNAFSEGKANLEIFTANGHIYIPQTSMKDFGKDLNFRVVPMKEEAKKNVVEERAKKDTLVQKVVGNKKVNVLGRPMEIETNMQNRSVDLTLPLPKNATQEQLDNLAIFIEHSDGTKELVQGKLVEYEKDTKGIQFTVNKFSTFTILYAEGAAKYFAQHSCDENAKASCLQVNKTTPMYVLENNRLKKVGEAVKGQNLAVKQTISPMLGLGGNIWLERTAAISYETPSKEMVAKNQLPANKRPKQMWKGLELTPGQIGKVTILEDTVIWESIDKTTKLPRVLKKGEQYRVYRYVPGMYQIGDNQYIVQDSNVVLIKK